MNREIYTYIDLKTLGQSPYWNKIRNLPQITITKDLQKSLKGSAAKDEVDGLFKNEAIVQVCEMRKLTEAAFPKWRADETQFHELVVLSQYVREQIARYGDDPMTRRWLVGCRRNLKLTLSSIILLEEAGIDLEDLQAGGDRNVEFLLGAWRYLKQHDPAIHKFRKQRKALETKHAWNPIFSKLFGRSSIHTVVFHGFYYFTPIQEKLMRLMEQVGIKVIFLFCYNERYPYAHEIWRKTYSVENGYPPITEWHMERSDRSEPYGEIFEGRKVQISNNLKLKEYASVMDFVREMKTVSKQGYQTYSSNPNGANQILQDFYPEEYGERKLLSYPIGQFVNTLNQLWDEDLQEIILDSEKLIDCFASGWLSVNGVAGKQYMQDLMYVLPFFADCRKVEEWEERMEFLQQIRDDVIEPFRENLDADASIARWQEVMSNPFLNFSMFAVTEETLDVILTLIRQLLHMAQELFETQNLLRVEEHIRKLDRILKSHELSNELYEEEREIVNDLFEKLSDPEGFTQECFPSDISSALNFYMSGKVDDGELDNTQAGMVLPLYHVEAACIRKRGKVHVCFCDSSHMPGGKKEYVWPLTGRHIRDCYRRTKNPLIVNMMHIMDCSYICNRYFLYAALKNSNVQISWIRDMGDKLLSPSPYVHLVSEASGISWAPAVRRGMTSSYVANMKDGDVKTLPYKLNLMPEHTAKEAKMDYAVCPMKYALGYVVEKAPTFQNEFHQKYAVNGLITAIYSRMRSHGMDMDEIYNNIIMLFPAMRNAEKRQVYDYLFYGNSFSDYDFDEYSELEEMSYSEERLKVRFPNKMARAAAMEQYGKLLTPNGREGMDFYTTTEMKKPDPCLFCQHQDYCRYATFAVDQEGLYD